MKLIDMQCTKCGATLQVNPELSKCMCQYCGNEMLIDNEVQKHEVNVQGQVNMTGGFEFGYQQQMGMMQAMMQAQQQQNEFNEKAKTAKNQYNVCQVIGVISFILCLIPGRIIDTVCAIMIIFLILAIVDTVRLSRVKNELQSVGVKYSSLVGLIIGLLIVICMIFIRLVIL